jgi:hypothetical protein
MPGTKTTRNITNRAQILTFSNEGVFIETRIGSTTGVWLCNECFTPIFENAFNNYNASSKEEIILKGGNENETGKQSKIW